MNDSDIMTVDLLILELSKKGVKLTVEGDQLNVRAPKGSITPELKELMRVWKQELIYKLNQTSQQDNYSTIPRAAKDKTIFPLSISQERIWKLIRLDPDTLVYNIPIALQIQGELDIEAFQRSAKDIVGRHDSLRTGIREQEGDPIQFVVEDIRWQLPLVDVSTIPARYIDAVVNDFISNQANDPFDLSQAPLWRMYLLKLSPQSFIYCATFHHIIIDGFSIGILLEELGEAYFSHTHSAPLSLEELEIKYADYTAWQRQQLANSQYMRKQQSYWQSQLDENLSPLQLPTDHTPAVPSYRGESQSLEIPPQLSSDLKYFSQEFGVTLFVTLLSAFVALLECYIDQQEVLICTPMAGRNHPAIQRLVGYLNNIVIIRAKVDLNLDFVELLDQIKQTSQAAFVNQDYPFQDILEMPHIRTMPITRAIFDLGSIPGNFLAKSNIETAYLDVNESASNFDLGIFARQNSSNIYVTAKYKSDLFEPDTVKGILDNYTKILERVVRDPNLSIIEIKESLVMNHSPQHGTATSQRNQEIVLPRNKTEKQLSYIWKEILDLEQLSVTDTFFERGGTSLLATQLSEKIEANFGTRLSLSQLASNATIESQAKLLNQTTPIVDRVDSGWDPIVPLQTRGEKLPFFAFHPAFGDAYIYRSLTTYLGQDQPFYGIQGVWLSGKPLEGMTIQGMVSEYVDAIQRIQPHGPYQIGGYSGGGVLAIEAALQLMQRNESIRNLVLLDVPGDGHKVQEKRGKGVKRLWMKIGVVVDVFLEFERVLSANQDLFSRVIDIPGKIAWYIKNIIIPTRKAGQFWETVMHEYISRAPSLSYPGQVTLIRTDQTDYRYTENDSPDMGWASIAQGGVEVIYVQGKHFSILMEPYVKSVAEKLRVVLE